MRRFLLRPVWLAILICVLVPTAALAAERAEPITVRAVFEGQLPLAGMRFDAYRVADRSSDGTWSLEPRFKAYRSRLETQSGDGNAWAALARVLERVALMDEACLPDDSAETDEEGAAVFDALEPGLREPADLYAITAADRLPHGVRGRDGTDLQSGKGGLFRSNRLG